MDQLLCVGGTARAALRLCKSLFGLPEGSRSFTRAQLEQLTEQLCKANTGAPPKRGKKRCEIKHGLTSFFVIGKTYQIFSVRFSP